jgi:hypothetical protein
MLTTLPTGLTKSIAAGAASVREGPRLTVRDQWPRDPDGVELDEAGENERGRQMISMKKELAAI